MAILTSKLKKIHLVSLCLPNSEFLYVVFLKFSFLFGFSFLCHKLTILNVIEPPALLFFLYL